MTQLEKFRAFANRHADKKATAQYFLEDDSTGQLVLVTENRFTHIVEGDDGDDVSHINFKDASIEYFVDAPKGHPEVANGHTLWIHAAKAKLTIACLPYDYARILRFTEGKLKENDDES